MPALTLATSKDLADQLGQVKPHVLGAAQTIAERFGITTMSGYRSGNSRDPNGHPAGLAIDIPATKAMGDAIAAYATANAAALGVKYVIWQQRIWYPGKDWTAMASRTGAGDQNHMRHVHISFTEAPPTPGLLEQLRTLPGNVIGTLSDVAGGVAEKLNPFDTWQTDAQAIAFKVAGVIAGLALVVVGMDRLVRPAVAGAVNKTLEAVT